MATRHTAVEGLGRAVQRYQRSVQAFDDAVGRRLGVSPTDLRCLDWLSEGPLGAGELATAVGLRPAATTTLVDRLAGRGLVRRRPSPTDRRRTLVELTEAGASAVWAAYGPLVEEGRTLLDDQPVELLEAMSRLLVAMTEHTEQHRSRLVGRDA